MSARARGRESQGDSGPRSTSPPSGTRSWERPRILFREALEAVAVACVPSVPDGPGKPDTIQCASPQS